MAIVGCEESEVIRHVRWVALALLVAACGSATATPQPGSVAPSGATIQLNQAPGDLGCDTIGVDYREVTFHIDPRAKEQVSALADTGISLRTFWSAGFQGGSATDKVVLDPAGAAVVTDGEVLAIPEGAFPRLHGYFVCPSPDALYILTPDPS
jgi:hypothetical protein